MLKKLILACVMLVIVAGAAAPFAVSKMVEKQYLNNISQLNLHYKDQLTLVGSFEAGYLTSKATTEIKFVDNPVSVKLNHVISNGPVILNTSYMPENYALAFITTTFDDNFNNTIRQIYNGKDGYNITTLIDYDGNGTSTVKLDPVVMDMEEGTLDWKGLNLVLLHNKDCTSLTGNIVIPSVQYTETSPDATSVKKVDAKDFKLGFSTGVNATQESVDLLLADLSVSHGEEIIFSAKKLGFTGTVRATDKLLKLDLSYAFDQLTIMQDKYGPFDCKLDFKNLDKEFFKTIADKAPMINQSLSVEVMSDTNSNEATEINTAEVMTDYPPEKVVAFLSVRPGVAMDFNLQMPDGKILFQASLDIGGPQIKEMDEAAIKDSITASLSFKIDQAIVYMFLAQYAENNINMMAASFAQDPANTGAVSPYALTDDKKQAVIEAWVISVLDKLKESRFILENQMIISSDITYDKNILTINSQEKSEADVNATMLLFLDVVKAPLAPNTAPSKSTTMPSTTMPATTDPAMPSTTMPATTDPTMPSTTMPATTDPAMPSTTMPSSTDPTMPGATMPATTDPTMPSTTMPATTDPTMPSDTTTNLAPAAEAMQPSVGSAS